MSIDSRINERTASETVAIVISNFGNEVLIETAEGKRLRAVARQTLPALVTGDKVLYRTNNDSLAVIENLVDRYGILTRKISGPQEKFIACNIDMALIVCAHQPVLKAGLIDRYLAACEIAAIVPHIIFNKTDSLQSRQLDEHMADLAVYSRIGYAVHFTSAKNASGLDAVTEALQNKTAVLVGQSGVGKSSLIRALIPSARPRIADISSANKKGRHTTTHSELYSLGNNSHLIDSPGIREFGLKPVDYVVLAEGFVEFRPYLGKCRFRDCQHTGIAGCAIAQAAMAGQIEPKRLESYVRILASFVV